MMSSHSISFSLASTRQWVKSSEHSLARCGRKLFFGFRRFSIPMIPVLHPLLYRLHLSVSSTLAWLACKCYWTPLFQSRLVNPAQGLLLSGSGMPQVSGPLQIECGANCRLSTQVTFSGRWSPNTPPRLTLGDNVGIGWQTTIACGRRVILGNNVRIAGGGFLAGYPGHPLNAADRAKGMPDTDDQIGDIVLEEDVWLGSGVKVMAGVTIGKGTVVAAGSIVTHDLPPFVLAAGVPARVIRQLEI